MKPVLSLEQERDLVVRAQAGDKAARDKLVMSHKRMVFAPAKNNEDSISAGLEGLLIAVDRYDLSKNFRFSTYARWWIRERISNQRRSGFNTNTMGWGKHRLIAQKFLRAEGIKGGWGLQDMATLDILGLSEKLKIPYKVMHFEILMYREQFCFRDSRTERNPEVLPDETSGDLVCEEIEDRQRKILLREALKFLTPREALVVNDRILTDPRLSVEQVGKKLDLSGERVRQLEHEIKERLKRLVIALQR